MNRSKGLLHNVLLAYEAAFGHDHLKTIGCCASYGSILSACHEYKEAVPYLRRALDGRKRYQGAHHTATLVCADVLACALCKIDKPEVLLANGTLREARDLL